MSRASDYPTAYRGGMPSDPTPPAVALALARAGSAMPAPDAMPGGSRYEPKWDGFRAVIDRRGDTVRIWSRQGKDLAGMLPDLASAAAEQLPDGVLVDGEAVVWSDGRLDFEALLRRMSNRGQQLRRLVRERPASFAAFDVLAVAGRDTTGLRWCDRRALLDELASDWTPPLNLSPVTDDVDEAQTWFEQFPASGIEGIVVKGADQRYEGGQRVWIKVKHHDTLDVVCAAVVGPLTRPTELVVGLPLEGDLRIVGRAPVSARAARALRDQLVPPVGTAQWPALVARSAMSKFSTDSTEVALTAVEPFVVEISADVAWSGTSFRHGVRYVRPRPEMQPEDVMLPERLTR